MACRRSHCLGEGVGRGPHGRRGELFARLSIIGVEGKVLGHRGNPFTQLLCPKRLTFFAAALRDDVHGAEATRAAAQAPGNGQRDGRGSCSCTWVSRRSPKAAIRHLRLERAFSSPVLGATQLSKTNWASSRRVATRSSCTASSEYSSWQRRSSLRYEFHRSYNAPAREGATTAGRRPGTNGRSPVADLPG